MYREPIFPYRKPDYFSLGGLLKTVTGVGLVQKVVGSSSSSSSGSSGLISIAKQAQAQAEAQAQEAKAKQEQEAIRQEQEAARFIAQQEVIGQMAAQNAAQQDFINQMQTQVASLNDAIVTMGSSQPAVGQPAGKDSGKNTVPVIIAAVGLVVILVLIFKK